MRILHYILGFPPHRSGGLTRYVVDLMGAEAELGHEVTAMYPGNFSFISFHGYSEFKREKDKGIIHVYQLTNALPVPLMYGIKHPKDLMERRILKNFDKFISDVNPDVFHIHTLMGIPIELLESMKNKGVRIVYTSHDYFGLCPRVNFINYKGEVCTAADSQKCMQCNESGKSKFFLKIRNSSLTLSLKQYLR